MTPPLARSDPLAFQIIPAVAPLNFDNVTDAKDYQKTLIVQVATLPVPFSTFGRPDFLKWISCREGNSSPRDENACKGAFFLSSSSQIVHYAALQMPPFRG